MKTVAEFVREHPLFDGIDSDKVDFIAGCGSLRRFKANDHLAWENDPADTFYLLIEGRVVIETHQHNQPPTPLLTLNAGDVVGWSWIIPPYRWQFDARAGTNLRTVEINGRCLREKCDADPKLGFDLTRRLAAVMAARLHSSRFQMLDVYSTKPPSQGAAQQ